MFSPLKKAGRKHLRSEKYLGAIVENPIPEKFKDYDYEFERVATFEQQVESLSKRGFTRPYKPYSPPDNIRNIVLQTAKDIGIHSESAEISGQTKAELLNEISFRTNGHAVPNSMLHLMTTVDRIAEFYSTPVEMRTTYERLHHDQVSGKLPPNIHIQLEPRVFTGEGDHEMERITAFPGRPYYHLTPEARKKYKDYVPEQPMFPDVWKTKMLTTALYFMSHIRHKFTET